MNAQLGSSRALLGQASPMTGAYQESQIHHLNQNQLHSQQQALAVNGPAANLNNNNNCYNINNQSHLVDQNFNFEQQSRYFQQQSQQQQSSEVQNSSSNLNHLSVNNNNNNNNNNNTNNSSGNICGTNTSHFDNINANIINNSRANNNNSINNSSANGNFIANGQNHHQPHQQQLQQPNRQYGTQAPSSGAAAAGYANNRDEIIGNDKHNFSSIGNAKTNLNMVAVTGNQQNMDICFNSQVCIIDLCAVLVHKYLSNE